MRIMINNRVFEIVEACCKQKKTYNMIGGKLETETLWNEWYLNLKDSNGVEHRIYMSKRDVDSALEDLLNKGFLPGNWRIA
ncbi:MAG: hypothetical protein LUH21_04260 [Clostridiales bacterium]|nr:hypothetical protein [Clostridiales bacterium]